MVQMEFIFQLGIEETNAAAGLDTLGIATSLTRAMSGTVVEIKTKI